MIDSERFREEWFTGYSSNKIHIMRLLHKTHINASIELFLNGFYATLGVSDYACQYE